MTNLHEQEQPVDLQLDKLLDLLRPTPPMEPEMVARGQAKFVAEADALFGPLPSSAFPGLAGWFSALYRPKEKFVMANSKQKFVYATLAIFIAIFILLFGGASATAYASQSSLPGDALYPVKTGLEQTQVRLSRDAADQAELHIDYAQRRLDEIAALIDEGRFNDIAEATSEFEYHVQQAIGALGIVSAGDAARAEELTAQITAALSNYASTLSGMATNVPESVLPAFERALMTSQNPSGVSVEQDEEFEFIGMVENLTDESVTIEGRQFKITSLTEFGDIIAVGVMVEVHYFIDADGIWIVREIELTGDEDGTHGFVGDNDDLFDDDDDDGNGNLSGAANDNDDDDDADNDNGNGNANDDANDNDDDNANGNDDANNTNDDDNANTGDDNSNDNSDDDNGNDNSGDDDNDNGEPD